MTSGALNGSIVWKLTNTIVRLSALLTDTAVAVRKEECVPWMLMLLVSLAAQTGLSWISLHRHHPEDVLTGFQRAFRIGVGRCHSPDISDSLCLASLHLVVICAVLSLRPWLVDFSVFQAIRILAEEENSGPELVPLARPGEPTVKPTHRLLKARALCADSVRELSTSFFRECMPRTQHLMMFRVSKPFKKRANRAAKHILNIMNQPWPLHF